MKRLLAILLSLFILCCFTSTVYADTKYGLYGSIVIIDTSESTLDEKANAEDAARNSENACTIIYDSTLQEYTLDSSVLWNGNYSKESFVDIVLNYEPHGIYAGSTGWKTFYQNFASEWFDTCTAYGLDPAFMLCVSCWQTGFGTSRLANECGNLFGLQDYKDSYGGDIPQRSMELLQLACERYSAYTAYGSRLRDLGACIAPEDYEFTTGIAKMLNKMFGSLNAVTCIKVIGDFRKIECVPTYSSLQ